MLKILLGAVMFPEAALHRCCKEKVFWKYAVNLHNAHVEVRWVLSYKFAACFQYTFS